MTGNQPSLPERAEPGGLGLAPRDREGAARPEAASLSRIDDLRRLAHVCGIGEAEQRRPRVGNGGEEQLRVRMLRTLDDLLRRSLLDDVAGVEDEHAVRDVAGASDVVRDVEERDAFAIAQLTHEVEDPDPDRDVEHGHRLVCDDELGSERERLREADALPLASAQLVREPCHDVPGRHESDRVEDALHLSLSLPVAEVGPVELKSAVDPVSDPVRGVDRGVRILEDQRDVAAVGEPLLARPQAGERPFLEVDLPVGRVVDQCE